jgi:hypothetical protein
MQLGLLRVIAVNPVGHGQFVTVWSKQDDGTFKFIMDFGSNLLPSSLFVKEPAFQPASGVNADAHSTYNNVDTAKATKISVARATTSDICQSGGDIRSVQEFASRDIG